MDIPVETVTPLTAATSILVRGVRRRREIGQTTLEWVRAIEEAAGDEVVLPVAGRHLPDRSVAPARTDAPEWRLRA